MTDLAPIPEDRLKMCKLIIKADSGDYEAEKEVDDQLWGSYFLDLKEFLQGRTEYPVSCFLLARLSSYQSDWDNDQDKNESIDLYEKAATLGSIPAINVMTKFYKQGSYGCSVNHNKVIELYMIGVNRGVTSTMVDLALFYRDKITGDEAETKAFELLERASKLGNHDATSLLIQHYEKVEPLKAIDYCLRMQDYSRIAAYCTHPDYEHIFTEEQIIEILQNLPEEMLLKLPRILRTFRQLSDRELYELRMQHEYQPGGPGFEQTKKEWMQLVTQPEN